MKSLPKDSHSGALSIQEAARYLRVSTKTLRRWEERGTFVPARTSGGHRRYSLGQLTRVATPRELPYVRIPKTAPIRVNAPETTPLYQQLQPAQTLVLGVFAVLFGLAGIVFVLENGLSLSNHIPVEQLKTAILARFPQTQRFSPPPEVAQARLADRRVLQAATENLVHTFNVNVSSLFREGATFEEGVTTSELTSTGSATLGNASVDTTLTVGSDVDIGGGVSVSGSVSSNLVLADSSLLLVGGKSGVAYNAFANSADSADESVVSSDNDVYVGGDLEVDGKIYGSLSAAADATTLDGIDSASFLRSDTSDNYTSGTLTFDSGTTLDVNGDLVISDSNISFDASNTTFTITGDLTLTPGGGDVILPDGTLLNLSNIIHDDSALQGLKLPQATTFTNLTSGEGFLAWDTDDDKLKVYNGSSWADAATGVTGSGTANQITFWSSSSAISGDAGLTYNSTTDILSVGSGGAVNPSTNLGSDLGSSSLRWNNLYVGTINSNSTLSQTGQALFTYDPTDTTFTQSSVLINPTSPATNELMLGVGQGGQERAGIDAEGDLSIGYSGTVTAPTTANPLTIYNHSTTEVASISTAGALQLDGDIAIDGGDITSTSATLTLGGSITTLNCTDCIDFDDMEDTLDLDTSLTLNQTTNTWSQSFTGTTTTGFTYTATSLTTGTALNITTSSNPAAAGPVSANVFDLTNANATSATTINGVDIKFTNNPTVAGNTENVVRIQNQATSNTTDNAVASLLLLDNADTTPTGSTVVTDALRITNSGGIAGGITNAINIASTTVTTDISLQNGETIDNDTNGRVTVTGDLNFTGKLLEDGNEILANMIAPFASTCPTGWTEYTAARGRSVVGTPASGTNAGTVGTALTNLQDRTHTHTGPSHQHTYTDVIAHTHSADPPSTSLSLTDTGHTHSVDPPSTGTDSQGAHQHSITVTDDPDGGGPTTVQADDGTDGQTTASNAGQSAGAHTHSVDIGSFTSGSATTGISGSVDITSFTSGSTGIATGTTAAGGTGATGTAATSDVMPYIQLTYCSKDAGADLAEWTKSLDKYEAGTVVSVDPSAIEQMKITEKAYDQTVLGIISTQPGELIGTEREDTLALALAGRVPVKVSTENGPIMIGDPLTSSSTPGVAMKATKAGPIIGKALESFGFSDELGVGSSETNTINHEPRTTNQIGKIMVFVNVSWYDPDVYLTSTGELKISTQNKQIATNETNSLDSSTSVNSVSFRLSDSTGKLIERVGAFANLIVAKLQAGLIQVTELIAETITSKVVKAERVELESFQMIDKATGDKYCVTLENGEFKKVKGECQEVSGLTSESANQENLSPSQPLVEFTNASPSPSPPPAGGPASSSATLEVGGTATESASLEVTSSPTPQSSPSPIPSELPTPTPEPTP